MVVNENLKTLISKYQENQLSHAFLIETNNIAKCLKDIKEVIKNILCKEQYDINCNKECNLCNLVITGNLPSLRIIETDNASIKKEQIADLKKSFQSKSLYTDFNIYIIKNAEKLTKSSANTMLKFLEEPDGQVIGFFITENKEKIPETIRSRCQTYNALYEADSLSEELHLSEEEYEKYLDLLKNYVKLLETNPDTCLLNNRKLVLNTLKERVELEMFLKLIFKIYNNFLNQATFKTSKEYIEFEFLNKNSFQMLIKKLQIINKTIDKLQYNPNLELLLDNFVIEMRELNG